LMLSPARATSDLGAGHAVALHGRDVGREQRGADRPPRQHAAGEEIVLGVLAVAGFLPRHPLGEDEDPGQVGQHDHDVERGKHHPLAPSPAAAPECTRIQAVGVPAPRYNGAMDVSHLIDGLNADQRQAVSAPPGHYLVLAGAGSGKTRVLTHRIAWLTEVVGVPAHGIFAVTFTNKAAAEMRQRTSALLERSPAGGSTRGMWIGTFHGLAHRLLRLHWQDAKLPEGFQILDSDDQQRLVKRVVQQLDLDEARFPPRQIAWWINAQKDEGRRPQHIQAGDDEWADVMRRSYALYQERCDRAGLVDFAELLLRAHELLRDSPPLLAHYRQRFGQVLVDEFQDTNAIQYAFVRVLAGDEGHVFVVGDDDQAIYGWRGAKVENVQKFLHDFPGARVIRLEQNYRSSATILDAANAVIAHNPGRLGKKLWTDSGEGEPIDLYAAY